MAHIKLAELTGESYKLKSGELFHVRCPECRGLQWFYVGVEECIYCGAQYRVSPFKVIENIPAELPEETGK